MTAGPEYLHRVLSRSLASRNQAVSLAAIRVLQRNSGQKSLLFALGAKQPLVEALNYPDREVRFNAALTIGGALPNKAFAASNMIVPILAEALNQEGNRFCVIVDQDARRRSAIKDALLDSGNFTDIITDAYYSNAIERARAFASIDLLKSVKKINENIFTKSGIMLGLGETKDEVLQVMDDLLHAKVDFLTIGQYLQPTSKHYPLNRYVHPDEFREFKELALSKGFLIVASSPLTRSSYHADEDFSKMKKLRTQQTECHQLQ
mgnify:CR=1 FL=1